MTRKIDKLIDEMGFAHHKVKSIYGANFGHLSLSIKGNEDKSMYPETNRHILDDAIKTLNEVLKNHPNIFGYQKDFDTKYAMAKPVAGLISFLLRPITFTMKIPESQKRFQFISKHREEFTIICSGSNYISYVELEDIPVSLNIGHEFREQIKHQFSCSNTNFEFGIIGPSPIHPLIICVCLDDATFVRDVKFIDGQILVFIPCGDKNYINDVYLSILKTVDLPMFQFYTLQKKRVWLLRNFEDIQTDIAEILKMTNAIEAQWPVLNLLKFHTLSAARRKLVNVYSRLVNYEQRIVSYNKSHGEFLDSTRNTYILSVCTDYLEKHTQLEPVRTDTLVKNLEFIERMITSRDQILNSLLSSLIGGIVGAIIGIYVGK